MDIFQARRQYDNLNSTSVKYFYEGILFEQQWTHFAERIVWIVHNDSFCFTVEFTG